MPSRWWFSTSGYASDGAVATAHRDERELTIERHERLEQRGHPTDERQADSAIDGSSITVCPLPS